MRTIAIFGGAIVAAALLTACQDAGPLEPLAADAVAEKAMPVRPFKGSFAGATMPGEPCGTQPWELILHVQGQGHATHLGATEVSLSACWDMSTFTPVGTVWATYIAANGDEVWMTADGLAIDPVSGLMTSVYTIYGGTGRFQHASGELDVQGLHFEDFTWTTEAVGWITY
jgi:hypothetical protein